MPPAFPRLFSYLNQGFWIWDIGTMGEGEGTAVTDTLSHSLEKGWPQTLASHISEIPAACS